MSERLGSSEVDPQALGGNVMYKEYPTLQTFGLGSGSIGEHVGIDEKLQEAFNAISEGEYDKEVSDKLPVVCIDGRFRKDGTRVDGPATAGGTDGLVYAKDLGGLELATNLSEVELIAETVTTLKEKGHRVCVHGDNHGSCGCGAVAKAKEVYEEIANNFSSLSGAATALGYDVTPEHEETFTRRAHQRLGSYFFAEERSDALKTAEDNGCEYEPLEGDHEETIIVWNTKKGTHIDTTALHKEYGVQVFVVDAWSFADAATELASGGSEEEKARIENALAIYNIATAAVLCHGSMRVLPR